MLITNGLWCAVERKYEEYVKPSVNVLLYAIAFLKQ